MDGGVLENGNTVKITSLDKVRSVRFKFTVSEQDGTHRILVRKGSQNSMFDFWVGNDLPLAAQ